MKQKWHIQVSQNGWEYTGYVVITAVSVEKTVEKTIVADGIEIEFDEEVGDVCLY